MSLVATGEVALPRTGSTGGTSAAANRREMAGRRAGAAAADPWARYVPPQTNLQLGRRLSGVSSRMCSTRHLRPITTLPPPLTPSSRIPRNRALRDAEAAQAVKDSERRWA
ncbi:hypothetical protein KC326_g169 [Hortaea werneckii]|nr:hypothetical protein KC326_g169 [Hortaea werneckii]